MPKAACASLAVDDDDREDEAKSGGEEGNKDGSLVSAAICCSESRLEVEVEGEPSISIGVGGRSFSTNTGACRRGIDKAACGWATATDVIRAEEVLDFLQ